MVLSNARISNARIFLLVVSFCAFVGMTAARADERLAIPAVYQQTPVWCWAAVGEMVFRYYRIPTINPFGNYQCGIVAGLGGPCWSNCGACNVPAGQMSNIVAMIDEYPILAQRVTGRRVNLISGSDEPTELGPDDIIDEIEAGRPIIAGISPSGMRYPGGLSEHVAVIIGYKGDEDDLNLIVNDPFPFQLMGVDPYRSAGGRRLRRGRYEIDYDAFVDRLQWNSTITILD